jgi:hypothetical protein
LILLLLSQCACTLFVRTAWPSPPYGGEAAKLDVLVKVESGTGQPADHALVGLVESIGARPSLTEERTTDNSGEVVVSGEYCLPMIVVVGNARVTIGPKNDSTPTTTIVENAGASITHEGETTKITFKAPSASSLEGRLDQQFPRFQGGRIDRTKHPDCRSP